MEIVFRRIYRSLIQQHNIVEIKGYYIYEAFHRFYDKDRHETFDCLVYDSLYIQEELNNSGFVKRLRPEPFGKVKGTGISFNMYVVRVKGKDRTDYFIVYKNIVLRKIYGIIRSKMYIINNSINPIDGRRCDYSLILTNKDRESIALGFFSIESELHQWLKKPYSFADLMSMHSLNA